MSSQACLGWAAPARLHMPSGESLALPNREERALLPQPGACETLVGGCPMQAESWGCHLGPRPCLLPPFAHLQKGNSLHSPADLLGCWELKTAGQSGEVGVTVPQARLLTCSPMASWAQTCPNKALALLASISPL